MAVRPPNGGSSNNVLYFASSQKYHSCILDSYINRAWGGQHGSAGPPPLPLNIRGSSLQKSSLGTAQQDSPLPKSNASTCCVGPGRKAQYSTTRKKFESYTVAFSQIRPHDLPKKECCRFLSSVYSRRFWCRGALTLLSKHLGKF